MFTSSLTSLLMGKCRLELPNWMHVSGKVAWYVFQGPYSELGSKGFSARMPVPKLVCEVSYASDLASSMDDHMSQNMRSMVQRTPLNSSTPKMEFRNTHARYCHPHIQLERLLGPKQVDSCLHEEPADPYQVRKLFQAKTFYFFSECLFPPLWQLVAEGFHKPRMTVPYKGLLYPFYIIKSLKLFKHVFPTSKQLIIKAKILQSLQNSNSLFWW